MLHRLVIYVKRKLDEFLSLISQPWSQPLLSLTLLLAAEPAAIVANPTDIIHVFLELGADLNAEDGISTTWARFVHENPNKFY